MTPPLGNRSMVVLRDRGEEEVRPSNYRYELSSLLATSFDQDTRVREHCVLPERCSPCRAPRAETSPPLGEMPGEGCEAIFQSALSPQLFNVRALMRPHANAVRKSTVPYSNGACSRLKNRRPDPFAINAIKEDRGPIQFAYGRPSLHTG